VKVSVVLADRGTPNQATGTLNLLNAGWSVTVLQAAPPGSPQAGLLLTAAHVVAVFFELEPRHLNRQIELVLELLTEDSRPVELPGPAGPQAMRIQTIINVPSPAGLPPATPGTGNTMLEMFPGLPVGIGAYIWRATLAGDAEHAGEARFNVRAAPTMPQIQFGAPPLPQAE
jgi:hypothetical protein